MAANTVSVDFSIPEGIIRPPKCLVALTGLDTRNNAVHMAIWDMFKAARRGERKSVQYVGVNADHLYPKRKQATLDEASTMSSPTGVLKQNWVKKHTLELPAVVVFFFDLDWSHPQWDDKVIECASKVKVIKSSLNGHNTEVCVALIQSVKPSPQGSDTTVPKKAEQLCTACELPAPNLFIMPYVDRPEGYVTRLEATFYEMALNYYSKQVKKIRISKEDNKFLTIRKMFKLAFFTELKQEFKEALKHYISIYKYILDGMVLSESRIMEFKMVAGFVNYKICKHFFEMEDPRNAIGQHQKFLETFKKDKGPKELLFQHMEWIASQYSAFGDLFAEAVRRSLKPTQVQHPGIYYYQAILHHLERRKLKETICKEAYMSLPHPIPHPFSDIPATEYIGERPWRVGLNDTQPSSYKLKEKTITMLQAHEYTINTSQQVTVLLSNALHHFKELDHHSEHMINHLKVLLSKEYFVVKDYQKCSALLQVAVVDYRRKRWWKILSSVLDIMLRCAYEQGLVTSYASICLELMSRFIPLLFKDKSRIQDNLCLVLKGAVPNPEPGASQFGNESVRELWSSEFKALQDQTGRDEDVTNSIVMSDLSSCIECKTWFTEHSYTSDSLLRLEVYFRSSSPQPILLDSVMVTFDNAECNRWCVLNEPITLEPNKHNQLVFEFPTTSDTLQVLTVEGFLGLFRLIWREGISRCGSESRDLAWNRIRTRSSTLILQREPLISLCVHHKPPVLLSEVYPVTVTITNNEERDVLDIIMLVVLLHDHEQSAPLKDGTPAIRLYSTHPTPTSFPLPPSSPQAESHYCVDTSCPSLAPGEKFETTFYVKSFVTGSHKLNINCTYNVDCLIKEEFGLIRCKCDKEETVSMETVTPLRVSHKILNMRFQPAESIFYDEPFVLQTNITSSAPWSVKITDTQYKLKSEVTMDTYLPKVLTSFVFNERDVGSEIHQLTVSSDCSLADNRLALGVFEMKWKRVESVDIEPASVNINLPHVFVKSLPYSLSVDLPAFAVHNEVFTITYKIRNRTIYVQSFDSLLPSSSDFVFSGNRLTTFRVLPNSFHSISFNLLPLNIGHVLLPKLEVTCTTQPKLEEQVLRGTCSNIPHSVFVMPSAIDKPSSL